MFDVEPEYKCELCGIRFGLRYFGSRVLCPECAKAVKELMEEEIWL